MERVLSKYAEEVLIQFHYEEGYCMGYRGLNGGKSKENIAAIKELKQHDMIDYYRGLMTEDGEVAGAGWCRSSKGNEYIDEFEL